MSEHPQRDFPDGDTQAWYRQFWPWFLMALPASVVVAGFITLLIAIRHADDLVVDEYYKDGLAINRQLEKTQRAQELQIDAQLQLDGRSALVQTRGPVNAEELLLKLSHPLESDRDFSIVLKNFGSGVYRGTLTGPAASRWHWTLEHQGEPAWRLDGTLGQSDIRNGGD